MSLLKPAKFAPVAPIQILEAMTFNVLGDYQLFLAHHTVEHTTRFNALVTAFTQRRHSYVPMRIIMDNSIVELGGAVDDQMIYEAVQCCVTPDTRVVPCLPDVMGNMLGTQQLSEDAYFRWEAMGMDNLSHCGYMLVTQAADPNELIELCDHFFVQGREKFKNISWVGIPRYMLKQGWESRKWAIEYIQMVAPHVRIHLLGFSENILMDMMDARTPGVQGIDSAVPVRYRGELLTTTTESQIGKRDDDWMEKGELMSLTPANIERVRLWADRTRGYQNSI